MNHTSRQLFCRREVCASGTIPRKRKKPLLNWICSYEKFFSKENNKIKLSFLTTINLQFRANLLKLTLHWEWAKFDFLWPFRVLNSFDMRCSQLSANWKLILVFRSPSCKQIRWKVFWKIFQIGLLRWWLLILKRWRIFKDNKRQNASYSICFSHKSDHDFYLWAS